jgi:hypothetical protein
MSEEEKLGSSAIPEIYYDVIARIVPGALVLGVYRWEDIAKGFNAGTLSVGLIFSYMAGLMLNLVAERFWHFIYFRWKSKLWASAQARSTDGELWLWIRGIPLIDRNLYTKMMAEKMLFASLSVGSLLMWVVPPPEFVAQHVGWWNSLILFAIFSACMFRVNTWLSWHMRKYKMPP